MMFDWAMATIFVVIATTVVPVIMIAIVMAGADEFLAIAFAAEVVVHAAVIRIMQIGPRFVDDYLVTVIKIEVMIAGRQFVGEDPTVAALVDKLVVRDVVVRFNVGNVIVVDMIVAGRSPGGLSA